VGAAPGEEGREAADPAPAEGRKDARVRGVFRAEGVNLDGDAVLAPELGGGALDKLEGAAARSGGGGALGRRWQVERVRHRAAYSDRAIYPPRGN
jgi:hypothetical protein